MEQLLYIVWNDVNRLGLPILDEQHRGIVAIINSYHYFFRKGREVDMIGLTLKTLEQYTALHFKTEETLLMQTAYPDLERHLSLHQKLMERTMRISREVVEQEESAIALKCLREWWMVHINEEDKRYVPHVKKDMGDG
jgi:hemerythrin-like metal-binding protein